MRFVKPIPFEEAVEKLGERSAIGAQLTSAEWSRVPVALRERAFFSSQVENVRFLQRAQDLLTDFLTAAREDTPGGPALKVGSRAEFISQARRFALAEGMGPLVPEDAGTLKDITGEKRLGLIFDVQTQAAQDYGNWKQGMDPDVLDEFPAQRFIREKGVAQPRLVHVEHDGEVRLKTDLDFWLAMNSPEFGGFDVPWGPWGFHSGMGVEDVDRETAEELGLLSPGQRVEPVEQEFNDRLKASVSGLDPALLGWLQAAFGDQAKVEQGAIWWKGDRAGKKLAGQSRSRKKAPVAPETSGAPSTFPASIERLEFVRSLGGSTGAKLVRDPETGRLFVQKEGNSPEHVREEFAADQIYRAAGVPVPAARLYDGPKPVKLAEFVEGQTLRQFLAKAKPAEREAVINRLKQDFAADALLGNWDVTGTGLDNILVDQAGIPWRIDNGGSLRFRAQGTRKTDAEWNEFPVELWSMRDSTQLAGKTFQGLGIYDIGRQIERLDHPAMLAAAPAELREVLTARLGHLRALGTKALDLEHDQWREGYAEELTRHMLGLRSAGIVKDLPRELNQAAGQTQPVDENGNPFDDLRTRAGVGTDPYWNDLLAAVKTLNKHGAAGDFTYTVATVQKALAHESALQQMAKTKSGAMAEHYLGILKQIQHAKAAADAKRFDKIGQVTAFAQKTNASLVARVTDYIAAQGGRQEIVAEWMEGQASDSWRPHAQAFKFFIGRQLNADESRIWWKQGRAKAETEHKGWMKRWGAEGERSLTIWHAFVQEVLGSTQFRHNDRARRAVRLIRTEKKAVMTENKVKPGSTRRMPRGLNESSSVFRTTRVYGSEITVQAVPHTRVTGLYLLERRPGAATSSFLGDGENEFTFVPYDLPFDYVPTVSEAAGDDAAAWGLDLTHLRQP